MIISHAHRYIFLETPRTGSSAIHAELVQHYDGEPILHKHANYWELPKAIRDLGYFVFAGVRNPLDDAASLYQKLLSDHHDYTNPASIRINKRLRRLFRAVHRPGATFLTYLSAAYPHPHCSRISANKKYCNGFIRFENLQQDFASILRAVGLAKKRDIPVKNSTSGKRHYSEYYGFADEAQIARTFGPFMIEWNYAQPGDPLHDRAGLLDRAMYVLSKIALSCYYRVQSVPFKRPADISLSKT
jgi:hypothetical protein